MELGLKSSTQVLVLGVLLAGSLNFRLGVKMEAVVYKHLFLQH